MSTVNEIITNLVPAGFLFFWWYIPLVSNHRGGDMGFYYVFQYKPKGMSSGKHLNVSEEFSDRNEAKRAKSRHMINDPDCVFSGIVQADSPAAVLQEIQAESLNRL
ncbi:hypothetical protein E4G04_04715 [Salmonella enterica]|nr:hypothetical protein [Salmonella enterica]EAA4567897.1 hypothetical protein [Salmonella enterica subsp. enterica serovar Poona]EDH8145594.1 hypothetical protein [Salmonella enterica subsp. enterica serovar Larochelle]EHX8394111.1 hypothetical protein [Salmonella enterica subsp. enterica serovar Idikan]EAO0674225.1 hypothetical protein [Salmonella enterica]EAO9122862.1 hypothetical protein [Salmonella enterica]